MSDPTLTTLLADCAAAFIGLLFFIAGTHKLRARSQFSGFLADYRLFPQGWAPTLSWAIIGAELTIPLAFLSTHTRVAGTVLAILLLMSYTFGMAINLYRGRRQVECGCGGPAQPLSSVLLVRNLCLAAIGLLNLNPRTELAPVATIAGLAAGLVLWSVYSFLSQVVSNQSQLRTLSGGLS